MLPDLRDFLVRRYFGYKDGYYGEPKHFHELLVQFQKDVCNMYRFWTMSEFLVFLNFAYYSPKWHNRYHWLDERDPKAGKTPRNTVHWHNEHFGGLFKLTLKSTRELTGVCTVNVSEVRTASRGCWEAAAPGLANNWVGCLQGNTTLPRTRIELVP